MADRKQLPDLPEATDVSPDDLFLKRDTGDTADQHASAQLVADKLLGMGQVESSTGQQTVSEALDQRVIYVDTIADLQALDTSGLVEGQAASVQGSEFRWDGGAWRCIGEINISSFGAKKGGDNTSSILEAIEFSDEDESVFSYGGEWGLRPGPGGYPNEYDGSAHTIVYGSEDFPTNSLRPMLRLDKIFENTNENPNFTEWDNGVIHISYRRRGGDTNAAAFTSFAWNEGTDVGPLGNPQIIAGHFRTRVSAEDSKNHAIWATVDLRNDLQSAPTRTIAMELNIRNVPEFDPGWADGTFGGEGGAMSLLVMRPSVGRITDGVTFSASQGDGIWTGIKFRADSIAPSNEDPEGRGECIRIQGGSTEEKKYRGIWFQGGHLRTALWLSGPTYENNAMMVLPRDTGIKFGSSPTTNREIEWTSSPHGLQINNGRINIRDGDLFVRGKKVVGEQQEDFGFISESGEGNDISARERINQIRSVLKAHGLIE